METSDTIGERDDLDYEEGAATTNNDLPSEFMNDNEIDNFCADGSIRDGGNDPRATETPQLSRQRRRHVARDDFLTRYDVSSRYDTCIVYALDECLMRGTYRVFAQWLHHYLTRENLPGCLTIVGFSNRRSATIDDDCEMKRSVLDLGGENKCPIPYVRLNPNDQYSIFDFKRQTGYPAIVLLITLPSSRMEMCLSCDGAILVHARHTLRRNMTEVAEVLRHLTREYLDDLYTRVNTMTTSDDEACDGDDDDDNVDRAALTSKVIGFEQRRDNDANLVGNSGDGCGIDNADAAGDYEYNDPMSILKRRSELMTMMTNQRPPSPSSRSHAPPISIECDNERWEDRFGRTTVSIPSSYRQDAPIVSYGSTSWCHRRGGGGGGGDNDAVARLYDHNRTLLNDLKRMDVTLTNTHPVDMLPVVHGESVDVMANITTM